VTIALVVTDADTVDVMCVLLVVDAQCMRKFTPNQSDHYLYHFRNHFVDGRIASCGVLLLLIKLSPNKPSVILPINH
jgi:hypothetical protein